MADALVLTNPVLLSLSVRASVSSGVPGVFPVQPFAAVIV